MSESSRVELSCTVLGLPLPQVTWLTAMEENGPLTVIIPGNSILIEEVSQESDGVVNSILTLTSIQSSQSGIYVCVANNSLGNDTAQTEITVYG